MDDDGDPRIVGIGASAGGVQALQAFFQGLPDDTGAAFVVVVHLDPDARSELVPILASRTGMPVHQVHESEKLLPNQVYVIPPDRRLHIADRTISALPFDEPRGQRAPIDLFFRSLAEQHANGFAIVLTGAGSDGASGVRAVKEAGGIILVQDPNEAEHPSMPRSAIATEAADFVLPVREMGRQLAELLWKSGAGGTIEPRDGDEEVLRRILAHVRVRTGHDFSQYKRATVFRRVARRAQVTRHDSFEDYYRYLRDNVEEAQALFNDFLISVTTFFRDPRVFEAVASAAIPHLFDNKEAGDVIRIWVPGCATGEEAYTIGILLLEEAAKRDVRPEIQVFGSDLDAGALAVAREGRYPSTIEADLTEDRLRRFFQKEGDHYRVRRELRDIVLFASHSLLRDPPFSRLDMISCRNLLIYLDRELQHQVIHTFHYALVPDGFLLLGSSESADQPPNLFRTVDRDTRIYRSVVMPDRRPNLPVLLGPNHFGIRAPEPSRRFTGNIPSDAGSHRQLLERVAPPSMLVDSNHHALHLSESAGLFLQPAGGPLSVDATDLVRPELRFDLRSALHRAFERNEATLTMPIPVRFNGSPHRVLLLVKPVPQDDDHPPHALVMFIEGEAIETAAGEETRPEFGPAEETIRRLREELQVAQNRLRATKEESEAATEELRAANEELQSINEEYRSTSEELETSKEELQSINEELQTVNNELKLKLESVSRANSDLQNLMAATDVGTLFLDPMLRIKRFTPRLTDLFNITSNDEGRPITDFTHQLDYDGLADHARAVLKDLMPVEHEVASRNGSWYLARIRPYRTVDDKIDGVVATFVDITERKRSEEAVRSGEERLRQEMRLVDLSRAPIFVWDFDGGITQWNRGSEELYGYRRDEALGRNANALLRTAVPGSSFDAVRESLLRDGTWSGELLHQAKSGAILTVESQIELTVSNGRRLCLESTRDVTEQKQWARRQQLLLGELNHRVKNTLAVVQAVARQTLRTTDSSEDFIKRFEGRLMALAEANGLLVDNNWQGADLADLARRQLAAYMGKDANQVRIDGEPIILPADQATPLGLVLHELATNAAKYGALSTASGSVRLHWTIVDGPQRQLRLVWQEQGGPAVTPPTRRGFGGTLIERSLAGAAVRREFLPDGLVCTIELPLPAQHQQDERLPS
ncbi:MAG: PAS domain-containing protein [Proteobacteria bacterium]|nr:PAS domain-containing protein [Pseudomonadota bacterium]